MVFFTANSDNIVFGTSECLKLCIDDIEMSVPVTLKHFELYYSWSSWRLNTKPMVSSENHSLDEILESYRQDCEMCLNVYDTALRLCDSKTMDSCLYKLSASTLYGLLLTKRPDNGSYLSKQLDYEGAEKSFNLLVDQTLIPMCNTKFGGNLLILRDVLTHLHPWMYAGGIRVMDTVSKKLSVGDRNTTEFLHFVDGFMMDCFTNFPKTHKLTDRTALALRYCDGDENITQSDIVTFIESTRVCPVMSCMCKLAGSLCGLETTLKINLRFSRMWWIWSNDLARPDDPKITTFSRLLWTSDNIEEHISYIRYSVLEEAWPNGIGSITNLASGIDFLFPMATNNFRNRCVGIYQQDSDFAINLLADIKSHVLSENRKMLISMDLEDIAIKYYSD